MIRILPLTIAERLDFYHQDHLLEGWDELSPQQQAALTAQLEAIDFDRLIELLIQHRSSQPSEIETPAERSLRARSPESLVRLPRTAAAHAEWRNAAAQGEAILQKGKVGAI